MRWSTVTDIILRTALVIGLLSALLHSTGCATMTWPAACPLEEQVRRCRCHTWLERVTAHPRLPRPAGVVGYECDGAKLPITVEAKDVGP